jgi:hypothetical protein
MDWIRHNTPEDASFLINARHWQLGTYVGTDAGYWIPRLTGRNTLLPELPYVYGEPGAVRRTAAMAEIVSTSEGQLSDSLQALVESARVNYIYIGARGGALTPQMFLGVSGYRAVYSTGAVWVFENVLLCNKKAE